MRVIKLATIQLLCFVVVLLSAEGLMQSVTATILFVVSFAVFVWCSCYTAKHAKELEEEINARFGSE